MDETMDQTRVDSHHRRPTGVTDEQVRALGLLSEALETVEQARGNLYTFHQLSGRADRQLQNAISALADAGHTHLADVLAHQLVGRNVLYGRWTYQVVEETTTATGRGSVPSRLKCETSLRKVAATCSRQR